MKQRGFSLAELLCVMSVIALLAVMGVSALAARRAEAQSINCVSNLRQWGVALQLYLQDNDGYLPRRGQGVQPVVRLDRPEDWFNCLPAYLEIPSYQELYQSGNAPKPGQRSVFVCPSAKVTNANTHFICYGMNMYVSRWDQPERAKITKLPDPSTLVFMADTPGGYASTVPSMAGYSVMPRHGGKANVSFLDGHVQSFAGSYLGCNTGEKTQPDVRWKTGLDGDTWTPM